jgi:DNA-binding Lrp family transcriptional regulator
MAKSSVKQIEKDEKKILDELVKNANKNINDIAKSSGFSRQKVWRVIKNLEKNKTIWGYTAIVDYEKLDKKRYIMLVKRTNKPLTEELVNKVVNRDLENIAKKRGINVINSIYINGKYDWLISFTANDIKEAKNLVELFFKLYPESISEIDLHQYMFPLEYDGIVNPEIKKLKGFFKF